MAHGGKREGAGRCKGAVTQAKKELAEMAKEHTETALGVLVRIAQGGESEAGRVPVRATPPTTSRSSIVRGLVPKLASVMV